MRIAYFSPLNPVKSGVSDYSEEMLFQLAEYFKVDLYINSNYTPTNKRIVADFRIIPFDPAEFDADRYDCILYHMGNSYGAHEYIYQAIQHFPGIVVLHDYILQGFYAERFYDTGDFSWYSGILKKYYSRAGEKIASEMANRMPNPIWEREEGIDFPLNEEIIENSKALIVHSDFVKKKIEKKWQLPVKTINLHGNKARFHDDIETRKKLGLLQNDICIITTGFINHNRRFNVILPAIAELNNPRVKYLITGGDGTNILKDLLKQDNRNVMVKGYLSLDHLEEIISASDICINLRYPTMGESSASLMRMMSYGKPALVSNVGSYAELPEHAVFKIDADVNEKELIKRALSSLIKDEDFRLSMGREAKEYVKRECSIKKCVAEYAEFIKNIIELES